MGQTGHPPAPCGSWEIMEQFARQPLPVSAPPTMLCSAAPQMPSKRVFIGLWRRSAHRPPTRHGTPSTAAAVNSANRGAACTHNCCSHRARCGARSTAYGAGTITSRSRPDSAPHTSPDRPSIWRTLAPERPGTLSNFSLTGSKRTIALVLQSVSQTLSRRRPKQRKRARCRGASIRARGVLPDRTFRPDRCSSS